MRKRLSIPAQQLGSAAGRYRGLLRPRRDRETVGAPSRLRPRGAAIERAGPTTQQAGVAGVNGGAAGRYDHGQPDLVAAAPVGQTRDDRMARLEAVLFVAKVPLHARKLGQYANLADGTEARTLIHRLNQTYDQAGRAFRVVEVAGGWQLRTRRQFASWLRRLPHVPKQVRLSAPAMETLAVIAYRQPVVRADVEAVRGVACGEIIRQLMDRDLVRVAGRSEELGRPFIYSTTKRFLEVFGLRDLDELPRADWLKQTELQSAAIVDGENERGESAVTLTATQQRSSATEQQTTVKITGPIARADDTLPPLPAAEAQDDDDDEYDNGEWDDDDDDDEDGEWEDDDDEEDVEEGDDEWEEVEVDDDDGEWEDVEEGDDLDDDEYEYEEVEVDDDDDDDNDDEYEYEYDDDDDDGEEVEVEVDDEYEYEEVDDEVDDDEEGDFDDDDEYEYEDDDWEDDDEEP